MRGQTYAVCVCMSYTCVQCPDTYVYFRITIWHDLLYRDEEEVASFLKREGIPDEFADTFKGKLLATSWIFRYLYL